MVVGSNLGVLFAARTIVILKKGAKGKYNTLRYVCIKNLIAIMQNEKSCFESVCMDDGCVPILNKRPLLPGVFRRNSLPGRRRAVCVNTREHGR